MTKEFVGCWWCCGVEVLKVLPVGAGGGVDGSGEQEGIQTQSPTPGD